MEENVKLIESLFEKAVDYGKANLELGKLKVLDKTSDVVSTFIPHSIAFFFIASFLLFINWGLALWLGEVLGKTWLGFVVVAAFYGLAGIVIHFFMHKWLKKLIGNFFIKQALK